jgi:hypothetical protein
VPVVAAGTHMLFDGEHAVPAAQHVRLAPVPHGVCPAGQPQVPLRASAHAIPFWQQVDPHGVVPGAQQHEVFGSVHVPLQHAVPHWVSPGGQAASARNGLRNVATVAPPTAAPKILSTPRRDLGAAI